MKSVQIPSLRLTGLMSSQVIYLKAICFKFMSFKFELLITAYFQNYLNVDLFI